MLIPAQTIRKLSMDGMIAPFNEREVAHGRTYGLGPASYDLRLKDTTWVWPGFGRLGRTIEALNMPDDVGAMVKAKSTNARLFVNASQSTFIDPGFRGTLVVEMTRHLPWPKRIRAGTPIVQLLFLRCEAPTEMPYRGKYQNQPDAITAAILEDTPRLTQRVAMAASRALLAAARWLRSFGDSP